MRSDVFPRRGSAALDRAARPARVLRFAAAALALGWAAPVSAQIVDSVTGQSSTAAGATDELRMGGFDLGASLSDSSGLNFVGQNYRNELSLSLEPRWSIGKVVWKDHPLLKKLSLGGRFVVGRSLMGPDDSSFGAYTRSGPARTCSNITPSENGGVVDPRQVGYCNPTPARRRTDYSDIQLTASLPKITTIDALGLDVSGSVRLNIPISAQSRFSTLRTGVGASVGFARMFLGDKLRGSYALGATKNFHAYSTPGIDHEGSGTAAEAGGNGSNAVVGVGLSNLYSDPSRVGMAGFNTSFSFSNSLSASYKIDDDWSVDGMYMWSDGFSYGHRCMVDTSGGSVNTCRTGADVAADSGTETRSRGHRKAQVFMVSANYNYRPWLGFSLGWSTFAPRLKPDSTFRQGFISTDYNSFTSLVFSASTSLDELMGIGRASSPSKKQP